MTEFQSVLVKNLKPSEENIFSEPLPTAYIIRASIKRVYAAAPIATAYCYYYFLHSALVPVLCQPEHSLASFYHGMNKPKFQLCWSGAFHPPVKTGGLPGALYDGLVVCESIWTRKQTIFNPVMNKNRYL
jgi:hypothetical protein